MPPPRDATFAVAEDLATVLELEPIDRNLFRGIHGIDARERASLYGGQVAAQALRAAAMTVAPDRFPHSFHGYFLRPGRPDRPVILHVDRDRDGRSFSARHVAAVQDGDVIFSMLASFQVDEPGGTFDAVPRPDPVPTVGPRMVRGDTPILLLDLYVATVPGEGDAAYPDRMWVRVAHPLSDDRLTQACALAYISDLGSGFGRVNQPGLPAGGPSIDHTVWFQEAIDVRDPVLLELRPAKAGGARGVYVGSLRDATGRLGALIGQEMLLRG